MPTRNTPVTAHCPLFYPGPALAHMSSLIPASIHYTYLCIASLSIYSFQCTNAVFVNCQDSRLISAQTFSTGAARPGLQVS